MVAAPSGYLLDFGRMMFHRKIKSNMVEICGAGEHLVAGLRLMFCFIPLFFCGGCVALPLATVGTLLGFAGSAATTGADVYNLGKLDFSVMAAFEECHSAAIAAVGDLQLHLRSTKPVGKRTDQITIEIADDLNHVIDIGIDRRAAKLCQCRIDVGLFGSEPTAKLIMDRFRRHLPAQAANASMPTHGREQGE